MKFAATRQCVLFVLLLGSAAAVQAGEGVQWKSPGYLVDAFVEVGLRSAHSTRRHRVHKWISPVNYFIVHRVGDEDLHRRLIRTHFEHLSVITGLPIRPAASQAAANYLIVMTSEEKLVVDLPSYLGQALARQHELLFRHNLCLVTLAAERKGSIIRAVAMIPVDSARARGELASCVAEELTHAMGLPNDSPKALPSIFSHQFPHELLSGLDYLLLQMLYDPRVKPGMDEKTVRPILQTIASEYARDNRFNTVERLAEQGGLAGLSP